MSLHVFANIVTPFGTAANNRAETEGNITTLQKLIWQGRPHTTVSAEAIRFALRKALAELDPQGTNRHWNEETRCNEWEDAKFTTWADNQSAVYADDDLLGFMSAEAAKEEGEAGSANVRRAVLEVTRAVSLTPWAGDVTFNAASPKATPSAAKSKSGDYSVPYGTELHATRYQYGLALTPERLRDKSRAARALSAIGQLGTVAGNQGRFLFDFAPDSIIIRITDDPAPRLLYCFETTDDGKTVKVTSAFCNRVGDNGADIGGAELIIGGVFATEPLAEELRAKGAKLFPHAVKAAVEEACRRIDARLKE